MTGAVDIDGLSTDWLSQSLAREVEVQSCERIGTGQTAATYRLAVRGNGIPSTIVAKVATGDDSARERVWGGVRAEVGFYTQLRTTVEVRAPHCWHAAAADDTLRFTLLLEDLAPRRPGVQVHGCAKAPASIAVENLAGLHAPRWNDGTLLELDFVHQSTQQRAVFLGGLARSAAQLFVDQYSGTLSAADHDTLLASAEAVESWLPVQQRAFSLLHGDYRLDNLMFATDAADVVAVDWQTLMIGPPARDLAYFLGNSLTVKDRRLAEAALVEVYHQALVAKGVTNYDLDTCFEDYRLGQIQGPMITMIGAAYATAPRTTDSDAMFLSMAQRSCAAIRDLRTLDLL